MNIFLTGFFLITIHFLFQKLAELTSLSTIGEEVETAQPETVSSARKADLPVEVTRPAPISRRGTGGRDVDVATNYVRLELEDGKVRILN